MRKLIVFVLTFILAVSAALPAFAASSNPPPKVGGPLKIVSGGTSSSGAKDPGAPTAAGSPPVVSTPISVGSVRKTTLHYVEGFGGLAISEGYLYLNMGPDGPNVNPLPLTINGRLVELEQVTSENGNKIFRVKLDQIPNEPGQVKTRKVTVPNPRGGLGKVLDWLFGVRAKTETVVDYGPTGKPRSFKIEAPKPEPGRKAAIETMAMMALVNSTVFKGKGTVEFMASDMPVFSDVRKVDAPYTYIKSGKPYEVDEETPKPTAVQKSAATTNKTSASAKPTSRPTSSGERVSASERKQMEAERRAQEDKALKEKIEKEIAAKGDASPSSSGDKGKGKERAEAAESGGPKMLAGPTLLKSDNLKPVPGAKPVKLAKKEIIGQTKDGLFITKEGYFKKLSDGTYILVFAFNTKKN